MTQGAFHEVVWLDHREARLYSVTRSHISELLTIRAPDQGQGHVHHKAGATGSGHVAVAPTFLKDVACALGKASEILIVGPSDAKNALKHYLDLHMPLTAERVRGVEAMKRVGKGEIRAFSALYFRRRDMLDPAGDSGVVNHILIIEGNPDLRPGRRPAVSECRHPIITFRTLVEIVGEMNPKNAPGGPR